VQFVIVDLDKTPSNPQKELVKKYYRGYIPHVAVLDASGKAVYSESGEVSESKISEILEGLLKQSAP